MDSVLDALGQLLLKALPTFILFYLVHLFLKWVLYRPMDRVLGQRWKATEGARKTAEEAIARAERKAAEYEEAIRSARAEIAREHEEVRARLRRHQKTALEAAREKTQAMIKEATARLAADADEARRGLQTESQTLAEQIASVLLERKAS